MELAEVIRVLQKNKQIETIVQFGSSLLQKKYRDIDLCIFTSRKFTLKEQLVVLKDLPQLYDISFFDDLPLHIRQRVCTEGKILFTRDYYHFLKEMRVVELEYPHYNAFLKEYIQKRLAEA